MTSLSVRQDVLAVLAAEWTLCPVFDLSDYVSIDDLPAASDSSALLVQFGVGIQDIAAIGAPGLDGWQETGVIYLHLLRPTGEPSATALDWCEQLAALFRGRRLGRLRILNLQTATDLDGAAIRLDGKWHGWSVALGFDHVICA